MSREDDDDDEEVQSGGQLHFVKISTPIEVLKRYAEILKLRLPMKNFEHIQEVGNIQISTLSIIDGLVEGVRSGLNRFAEPFKYDASKFPSPLLSNHFTATFSRDKEYLFDMGRANFFSQSVRSRIIEFILKRKKLSPDPLDDFAFGIDRALNEEVYTAAYPLHDGYVGDGESMRDKLSHEWSSIKKLFKFQPLDAVRDYFGVKVALYFAWLGFYTNLLIFPSVVGMICFIYGLINLSTNISR